jgi:glycosyltransferase involved in cell wall biosynthesis
MGRAGWELVKRRYTPEAHYEVLTDLYRRLICGRRESGAGLPKVKEVERPSVRPLAMVPHGDRQSERLSIPERRSLRVAFIGGRGLVSKYSGIETYYEEVGKRLSEMGHNVTAYCRTYFTPPSTEHNGIGMVRLPTIRSKHLETLVHTFLSTMHVLTQPCDVVHFHALGPALFSFIPRLAGKKTVVTVQGLDWQRKKWGRFASAVLQLGEQAAVGLPSHTMVVSRELQKHYRAGYGVETSYIPNGGLLRERRLPEKIVEWGLKPGEYILFLGRFSPEKGCHLLIDAYESMETNAKLVMAGASSYCRQYAQQMRSHAGERIKIMDGVSGEALDELLTNAMIFVLPSELEGLSLALLDAMGAGICVVASDVPENLEAIGDAGFTFRRGDSSDLANRLRFLIANPAVCEAAGEAAKRRVRQNYQWSMVAREIERVYFEMMGWEVNPVPARKPSGRVADAQTVDQRRVG